MKDANGREIKIGGKVARIDDEAARGGCVGPGRQLTVLDFLGKNNQFILVEKVASHHIPVHCCRLVEVIDG